MRLILSILLLALPALADTTIINVTNNITAYNAPSSSYSLPAGDDIRINAQVTDGATNVNFVAGGGHTFRVDVFSLIDQPKALVFTGSNATTAAGSLSDGQVRFEIAPLPVGRYEVYGVAIPANDPASEYPVAWHTLTVTQSVAAGGSPVNIDLIDIHSRSITNDGDITVGGTLTVSNLAVLSQILAADTGAVKRVGSGLNGAMTGTLTNWIGFVGRFFGDGGALSNLNYGAITNPPAIPDVSAYLSNGGFTINGDPATNGAAFTVSGGSAAATGMVWLAAYDTEVVQTNTFTFSGIPLTGKALKIISSLEVSSATAGPRNQGLRINNNTNAHYSYSQIRALHGAAPSTTAGYNDTSACVFWSQNQTNGQAQAEVTFIDYAGTNNHKGYLSMSQVWYNNGDPTAFPNLYTVGHHFGYLRGLGAVTSITVFSLNSEPYVRGRADLYMVTY